MSRAKLSRERKRQLGQFLTPPLVAKAIIRRLQVSPDERVLEPSLGTGAFIFALLDALGEHLTPENLIFWAHANLYGCEIDERAMENFTVEWNARGFGNLPQNIARDDFFRWLPPNCDKRAALNRRLYFSSPLEFFDLIIGNPPFGGSIDPLIQDELDQIFGARNGMKIKKETYAFFLLKCLDLLKPDGRLCFICSDTILTIPTMRGLRYHLQEHCDIEIESVPGQFEETTQNLILITLVKRSQKTSHIRVFGDRTRISDVEATPNLSWRVNGEYARYFGGETLGDIFVASSGMTVGNNSLFLRQITNGMIEEPYEFSYAQEPITLAGELERARLIPFPLATSVGGKGPDLRGRLGNLRAAGLYSFRSPIFKVGYGPCQCKWTVLEHLPLCSEISVEASSPIIPTVAQQSKDSRQIRSSIFTE